MTRKVSLSISQWHGMALDGKAVPMRIPIHGGSMFPLIRMDRDYVTILPLEEELQAGDIVLICDPAADRYVLHRVWRLKNGKALTWGDNCPRADGWQPLDSIWGKAALIERGKHTIRPDRKKGMRLARFWHIAGYAYRPAFYAVMAVKRRINRLRK